MLDPTSRPSFQKLSADDQLKILQVLSLVKRTVPAVAKHLHIDGEQQGRLEVEELERLAKL